VGFVGLENNFRDGGTLMGEIWENIMTFILKFELSDITNTIIAISALATAIAAWRALTTWKDEHSEKNSYEIAKQCMRAANVLQVWILADRRKFSRTSCKSWDLIRQEVPNAEANFLIPYFEAEQHFGKEKIGGILKGIADRAIEFNNSADIFFALSSPEGAKESNTPEQIARAKEIFQTDNPLNDKYALEIGKTFKELEDVLAPYLKKD
jgi:hypothetical protein